MNKLLDKAGGAGLVPTTDNTRSALQLQCPFCQGQMLIFKGPNVPEEQFEEVSGLCRICDKKGCCADDHVLHGTLIPPVSGKDFSSMKISLVLGRNFHHTSDH